MSKKKKKPMSFQHDDRNDRDDKQPHYTPIYDSMLNSFAVKCLNPRQFKLLVHLLRQFNAHNWNEKRRLYGKMDSEHLCFLFSWTNALAIGYTNKSTFYADMSRLEEIGFIRIAARRPCKKTLYAYSERWKTFEEPPQ